MQATTTVRARKSRETRQRLEETALRLFRSRGFDQVTVEDICREAHVGPATFYRHFGTKEDVLFAYRSEFTAAMVRAVASAPADAPRGKQLEHILMSFAHFLESQADVLALRDGIVLDHEGLMRGTVAVQREVEAKLATGLAELRGLPEPDDALLAEAAVGIVVLRMAVRAWRAQRRASLAEATTAAYAQVREALWSGD
jgi:AcrR family transcriptional regulator